VTPSTYRYPDLVMSCDDRDQTAVQAIQFPKLIAEVLSAGTEARDRGEKFKEYRAIPSLEEYVLISSTQVNVEIYRRGEGRLWLYTAYQIGDMVPLANLGLELPIAQLYEAVHLPE
jgi:Uma2 family endonuclease